MSPNDERVLVLAPTGQDAALICEHLAAAGLSGLVCASLKELINAVLEGAAAALIAEEALDENGVDRLLEVLHSQPAWSDLPIVVLSGTELHENPAGGELLPKLAEVANVTLIERPSRIVTLIMTVQAAVRARRRQYEFREYLREYDRYQEQVRHTQKLDSLGVLDGEAILRVLKAVKPSIKVILSSGYDETEALRRFTGRGLAGFIQKPYTNKRLLESIHRALENGDTGNSV
jgi:CheY-like chemotaxis protein